MLKKIDNKFTQIGQGRKKETSTNTVNQTSVNTKKIEQNGKHGKNLIFKLAKYQQKVNKNRL